MKNLENIKSENGSALILVLFITLCCIIIAGTIMYVTFNQVRYSKAYKKSSNISYLAISGAEKVVNDFNNLINNNLLSISNEVAENISSTDNFKYDLEQKIISIIDSKINKTYTILYKIKSEEYDYKTEIKITKSTKSETWDYTINSKTTNITTSNTYEVSGQIEFINEITAFTLNSDELTNINIKDTDKIGFKLNKLKSIDS